MEDEDSVERCLEMLERGDRSGVDELLPRVYGDLRALAQQAFRQQRNDHTLQPTALVHEVYLRLTGSGGGFRGREHFLAVAATAMRQLLADHARKRASSKRGGDLLRAQVEDPEASEGAELALDLVRLDRALDRLSELDARQARVVEMRFLAGMTYAEIASVLGVSERTAQLDWQMARSWLGGELERDADR